MSPKEVRNLPKTKQTEGFNTTPEQTMKEAMAKAKKKGEAEIEKKVKRLTELKVVTVDIAELNPNDWNPNRQDEHEFEMLRRSMIENGFTMPILVQRMFEKVDIDPKSPTYNQVIAKIPNVIVDGEHRWRAAQSLVKEGWLDFQKIPVTYVDMTKEQMMIATLSHNRARGSEDFNLSAALMRDLQELGAGAWVQNSLGISDEEFNRMVEDVQATDLASEEFSQAWEPDKIVSDDVNVEAQQEGDIMRAGSIMAVKDVREREKLLKEAKTVEERIQIRKDMAIFRVSLIFSGDEAKMVKAVLGKKPAETLIEMCKEQVKKNGITIEDTAN